MKPHTPFLETRSFAREEAGVSLEDASERSRSPFLEVHDGGTEGVADPVSEEYVTFLNELYDDELEDALFGLVSEAAALHETRFSHEHGEPWASAAEAERVLEEHFAPLLRETDAMLAHAATALEGRAVHELTEAEVGAVLEGYEPAEPLSPEFEDFVRRVRRTARRAAGRVASAARQGVRAAAQAGASQVLQRLRPLIRPLLQRVIRTAIRRLPSELQPLATRLAQRLPAIAGEVHEHDPATGGEEVCEVARIQYEFNRQVANLVYARGEAEQELEVARALRQQEAPESYPIQELDRARDRFVEKVRNLKEGEDPTPVIEEFVPALLPVLRTGIRLVGRRRVVDFLAQLLGRMIQRFVGPRHTPALSRAIVDTGLRLIQLEAAPDDAPRAAAAAIAATVEDTVRRVGELPDYVLDDRELFEGFALRAFEAAAAANLPPILSEETYRARPDLAEARRLRGTWVALPAGRRKRYKKFSRTLRRRLTPHAAEAIESFEGIPLEEFLEEELGIAPGEEFEAVVHLYEALPGTHLPDIARLESQTPGLGSLDAHDQLHPLTREAAGVLLGEPELGREVDPRFLVDPHMIDAGQRLYYLEIPGRRPLATPAAKGRERRRQPTRLRLVLDFPKNEIRVRLFLSEIRAQQIGARLRERAHTGAVAAALRAHVDRGLRTALSGGFTRLKLIHEAVLPQEWARALQRLPSVALRTLRSQLSEWVVKGLASHLRERSEEFVEAANDTADGVTAVVTVAGPPGLPALRQALRGRAPSLADLRADGGAPTVNVRVLAGQVDE